MVESNASNVVKAIRKPICRAPEANVVDDIRDLMSNSGSGTIHYASHDGNVVAHILANYVISYFVDCIWIDSLPKRLGAFVIADLVSLH